MHHGSPSVGSLRKKIYNTGDNIMTVGKTVVAWEKIREKGRVSVD